MQIQIPYDRTAFSAEVGDIVLKGVYSSKLPEPAMSGEAYVSEALDNPIASQRLEDIAVGKRTAVVIASDHTRPVPSRIIMPQILERLRRGQPDIDITILIATGCHRQTTEAELSDKFGAEICRRERIVIHDADDAASLVEVGRLPSGGRLILNKLVMETELVVAEGFVEPHFFAGFSGGRKSVLPGIAARESVMANHCAEFISSPYARTGNLENNPIHKDMLYAAEVARLAFIVNVVLDEKKRIVRAVSGDSRKAHEAACAWLLEQCRVAVPTADIVITSNGGYPLDQNVYQSVKGMTAAEACCRAGGVIVMVASCKDGHGGKAFYESLSKYTAQELQEQISRVPRNQTKPDQWQVQIMARVMANHTVIMVTTDCSHNLLRSMHLLAASTIDEALALARQLTSQDASICVIPDGVSVITA